jgi:hypothetical protein
MSKAPDPLKSARGQCKSCSHWFADGYECRRYPPTILIAEDEEDCVLPVSVWPQSDGDEWCGEFRPVD